MNTFHYCLFNLKIVVKGTMDPALLKEREAFKRRALANPVVEKLSKKLDSESATTNKTKVAKKSKDDVSKPRTGNGLRLVLVCDVFGYLVSLVYVCTLQHVIYRYIIKIYKHLG